MKNELCWNEEIELMSQEEMQDLQWKKLKKTLDFVYEKSAFYRNKFDEAGIKPSDIRSFDDFSYKVPVTTKEELRDMQKERYPLGSNMTVSSDRIVWVTASTGTTGKPTYTCCTRHDWEIWMEVLKRFFWLGGLRQSDIYLHALGLSTWIAGIPLTQAAREVGATVVSVGVPTPAERMLALIEDLGATTMACTPSYAEHFAERTQAMGINARELGIRKIMAGGEPGAGTRSVKKKIEELWQCELLDICGTPEMIPGDKVECCDQKSGMHIVDRDFCYNEICDPKTKLPLDLKDGVEGALIYTSLDKEAGPLIRFDVQDQVKVLTTPCECGYPGIRVTVTGRYDDMLKIKGVKVWPATIKDVLATFSPRVTSQFKIVLREKTTAFRVVGPTKLRVEYGPEVKEQGIETLRAEISDKIRAVTLWAPEIIEMVPPGTILSAQFKANYIEIED